MLFNPRYSIVLKTFLENPSMSPSELKELIVANYDQKKERVVEMKFRLDSFKLCVFKD